MKFIHISDLHLGKRLNEYSLIEDQAYILNEIHAVANDEKPDGLIVAGDIYDKSAPSSEAVSIFDDFLSSLSADGHRIFVISGNHDSAARVSYGARIMNASRVYISAPEYKKFIPPITLDDKYGSLDIYLLPFIKPAHVQRVFAEEKIENYTDALNIAIKSLNVNPKNRNLLVAHQFVTTANSETIRSDSEDVSVGGLDNVDASVFELFDYVALGHLHRPQNIGSNRIRYSGSPLKYSFSESDNEKSVTVITMEEKGKIEVRAIPLKPMRDLRVICGTYNELTSLKNYEGTSKDDYLKIILKDEEIIPDAIGKLRVIYNNIMKISYDNKRTQKNQEIFVDENDCQNSPLELAEEFYKLQNNQEMSHEQREYMEKLLRKIMEDDE